MVSVACHGGFAPDDGRAAGAGVPAEAPEIDARHMSWRTGTDAVTSPHSTVNSSASPADPDGGPEPRCPPPAPATDTDPWWWWGGPRDADAGADVGPADVGSGGPGLMP
ncbi:hypothetical protein ACWENR_16020 [Micromonospora sp. NPDC004336]